MITIPNLVVYKYLKALFLVLRDDIHTNKDTPKESMVYKLFQDMNYANLDFYDVAEELIGRKEDHPKNFDVRLSFDKDRVALPTVHVTMGEDNIDLHGIGGSTAYNEEGGGFSQRIKTFQIDCIITSDNKFEMMIIYEIINNLMPSMALCMNDEGGLMNVAAAGKDITIKDGLVPQHIYMRQLTIFGKYQQNTPSLEKDGKNELVLGLMAKGKIIGIC